MSEDVIGWICWAVVMVALFVCLAVVAVAKIRSDECDCDDEPDEFWDDNFDDDELAKAWDAGWHEHYLEHARQKEDPSHPITKHNPYEVAS